MKPREYVIGADPGKKGAMVLVNIADMSDVRMLPTCTQSYGRGKKDTVSRFHANYMFELLQEVVKEDEIVGCYMENVHSIFGSSAKANFEFGEANGALRAVLEIFLANYPKVNMKDVTPKVWQKAVWKPEDIVADKVYDELVGEYVTLKNGKPKLKVDTKATSMNAAHRLFPDANFVMPRCRIEHDGCIDAALIAYYGVSEILG